MSDIKKIDTNAYVTVQGQYAVVNEGAGYAIINIQTKQIVARNISSFLDCVKTLEYIVGKGESQDPIQYSTSNENQPQIQLTNFGVKPDVQRLIEIYAPATVRVEKKVHWNRSRYKCYDLSGNCLGRVKGKQGDRYWEDINGNKHY
ncbi:MULTISPECIES: hypothetical protein [Dolichospermum]|uniref:Uncharacterized protein n=1 Tax=Dolichospermum heterosporum TAC447 TaxID=747523 RepID=A0ABY5M3D9_9CYAN|nr:MULTISPECIES: hypothetical protein [Dolichospermum]MBE9259173.1 hypothetical protein [Dolichospermum sp. LEGE 00246]MDK2410618.1 hypothetical protein [Aphanizomenon sp. 202]MDK2461361.1 hypothetical protein [Aphanizomenon sp. PH219]UUO17370.1 hypothetical protein NG743_10495 [Dolichospermum heterosporum TAC447]